MSEILAQSAEIRKRLRTLLRLKNNTYIVGAHLLLQLVYMVSVFYRSFSSKANILSKAINMNLVIIAYKLYLYTKHIKTLLKKNVVRREFQENLLSEEISKLLTLELLDIVVALVLLAESGAANYRSDVFPIASFNMLLVLFVISLLHAAVQVLGTIIYLAASDCISPKVYSSVDGSSCNIKECPICREDFNQDENVFQLQCKHYFHDECIREWLQIKKTCPLCTKGAISGDCLYSLLQNS
ncbi:hypothetical protein ENBRE01_0037 [Enteropsectra breve]|nr:hypothetical protein ENBRE01_0037 [Enteropsectra breve]